MPLTAARFVILDTCLLLVSFFCVGYIKFNRFDLPPAYLRLFYIFVGCWLISSLVAKKFHVNTYKSFGAGARRLIVSMIYLGYCLAFVLVMMGMAFYSRSFILSVCVAFLCLEFLVWAGVHGRRRNSSHTETEGAGDLESLSWHLGKISYWSVVVDFGFLYASFMAMNYIKREHFKLLGGYDKLLLIMVGVWFLVSIFTRKFFLKQQKNFYFTLWQWIKANGVMAAVLAVLIFGFNLFRYSRAHAFGTILILMVLEIMLLMVYFSFIKKTWNGKKDINSIDQVKKAILQEPIDVKIDFEAVRQQLLSPVRQRIQNRMGPGYPGVPEFLDRHLDLVDIKNIETIFMNNGIILHPDPDTHPMRLLLYTRKLNDIRRLNRFFLAIHQFLVPGGFFVGYGHTLITHRTWIFSKFPRQIAMGVYIVDFVIHRVMPKLPGLKQVYFAVTRGRNRVVSTAEFLGRLSFCGFEIVAAENIGKRFWFIARKMKTPSLDQNPTYGPLVGLSRSGFGGAVIRTYKFRTMHPYSEYLQQYLYDNNGLQKGGKIENDFRTTAWGKVMRKCWLDELPMLYNWLRGELQIMGVRPLSLHYLSLYPSELQELRKRVRPGLIPPFYADLPSTFNEICESEKRYIEAFLEHPIRTQCRYFFKIFFNIFIKGVRSN
ncbi:sugar transferase [uncultured Desulfobacter sp.]|uniref:sugar transferase n=1 Tax=uncultured Desulfobacter sp. TaxID=240139 RepID=UPI0029F483AA|nr:sugar transferase [uncultured Desulfobacter sp.]